MADAPDESPDAAARTWTSVQAPFLSQQRAHSTLRHELDAITKLVERELERRRAGDLESTFETHVLPNRLIARFGNAALSFSWLGASAGQSATVAEGQLLVIQWTDVADQIRGVAALRSARVVRERVYRAQAVDAANWQWRIDGDELPGENACSTDDLVAAWLASS